MKSEKVLHWFNNSSLSSLSLSLYLVDEWMTLGIELHSHLLAGHSQMKYHDPRQNRSAIPTFCSVN